MRHFLALLTLALIALSAAAGASGANGYTVDLATGFVNGHRILGRTVAGVTAGLGSPDYRVVHARNYRIGWGGSRGFTIEVLFRRSGGVQRAWSVAFESGSVRDPKVGDVLARRSPSLQAAVLAKYGSRFALLRPYACRLGGSICVGEFAPRAGSLHLTFGSHKALGTWLTLWTR